MKSRVLLAIAAGAVLLSATAPAENYYVRNRPFTQVVTAGGETMVGAEAFLRAVGLNWSVDGNVVTLTEKPASNPTLGTGPVTYKYNTNEVVLEASQRGGSAYVPLRPLAKLLDYHVSVNRGSGTVDVSKARFSSDAEKKQIEEVAAAREAEKQKVADAWKSKAQQLKEKREEKERQEREAKEGQNGGEGGGDNKPQENKPKEETPPPVASNPTDAGKPAETKPAEPVKEARLEVFRTDANPDPSSGTVTITVEVKNMGDAASKPVSGQLTLTGPAQSGGVTDNANATTKVWMQKTVSGPSIVSGGSWSFTEKYRHPSGNAMPIGNITAVLKLNNTK